MNPRLGTLRANGGPVRTHAPTGGSPAVDAGNPAGCLATDQRGQARPVDGNADGTKRCDLGAVEYNGPVITKLSPASRPAGSLSFILTISGRNFTAKSVVLWNGQSRTPDFENSTALKLEVTTGDLLKSGKSVAEVLTPAATLTSGRSNAVAFTVTK